MNPNTVRGVGVVAKHATQFQHNSSVFPLQSLDWRGKTATIYRKEVVLPSYSVLLSVV